ncbi:MAG: MoaD/ThiS family protein [Proteobacteria bacterium]|nr:MoaD/ThiS family protein [Pseudomonadota bacterium]
MRLYLGSYLSWYVPQRLSRLEIPLAGPISLMELLAQLKLPPAEISIAAVNGILVPLQDTQVSDGDLVEFHPPVGGG